MATMDDDEGPQLVNIATLGETPLPSSLDSAALILRVPEDVNPAHAKLLDWITLCAKEQCALITASIMAARKPELSKDLTPAMVTPPGEVTRSLRRAGCSRVARAPLP